MSPKSPVQIQQEMAIVVANGGRFNVWDNPTPESGLTPERHEFLAKHVAPWLAARKSLCLGSIRLPDVSLFNGAAAHYAVTDASGPICFHRRNNRIDGATNLLPRLHLNYEMVGDWRLFEQDVRSPLLIVEHAKRLTTQELDALTDFVQGGGRVLLSAMGVNHGNGHPLHQVFGITGLVGPQAAEPLVVDVNGHSLSFEHHLYRCELATAETRIEVQDQAGNRHPLLTCNRFGDGEAYYFATPLLTAHGRNVVPVKLMQHVFQVVAPSSERWISTDAPQFVEVVLRQQPSSTVLHLVNMASGEREVVKSGKRQYVRIHSLPTVPPCHVTIRAAQKPTHVTLQPQDIPLADWSYEDGRVQATVPEFNVHQMVVLQFKGPSR